MLESLLELGFKKVDAQVYLFLTTLGPQEGRYIAGSLELSKSQLYRSIRRLKNRGIVNSSYQRPAVFSSVAFEEFLGRSIEAKREQTYALQKSREELLNSWRVLTKNR